LQGDDLATPRGIVTLLADRFRLIDADAALDMASGRFVHVVQGLAGSASDQLRWTLRCEWFAQLRHHAIAPLIDYGPIGESHHFEAWCSEPGRVAAGKVSDTLQHATAFLEACGRSAGAFTSADVRRCDRRFVVVPGRDCGFPTTPLGTAPVLPLEAHGISLVSRRGVRALVESIRHADANRPLLLGLRGERGAGLSTAALLLARAARSLGFAPVRLERSGDRSVLETLSDRSLLLIVPEDATESERWRRMLQWTLRSGRPHIHLTLGHRLSGQEVVALERVSPEALVQAVVPPLPRGVARATIERFARRANGLPGRFVGALWKRADARYAFTRHVRSVAAERPAQYDADSASQPGTCATTRLHAVHTADGERRLKTAVELLGRGRHEAGCRNVRAAVGALTRRSAWGPAGAGLVALARSLLVRGQPEAARSALHDAEAAAGRAGDDGVLLDVAILTGTACTDLTRLDDAQRTLMAATEAAKGWRDDERHAAASLALSRCLFWRGEFVEAGAVIGALDPARVPPHLRVRGMAAESRAVAGAGDLTRAIDLATRAVHNATSAGLAPLIAESAAAAALVHLAVGDRPAVERECAAALDACRSSRDPLRALKVRLLAAESLRRAGAPGRALALTRRARQVGSSLPPIVRVRAALLADLLASPRDSDSVVARYVVRTGLGGLRLLATTIRTARRAEEELLSDVLDIMRSCQAADEELVVLERVCARLRATVKAAGVAIVSPPARALLAADGPVDDRMASRVVECGQPIPPHLWDDAVEGGSPVIYGGDTLGAVIARWTVGAPVDAVRAAAILTTAATAIAPIVAAVTARRSQVPAAHRDDLVGSSAAIEQIRRAIERAARAPFHVLVEGESGCGKELVARALHRHGPRRDRPFCTLNCAALPDDLVETELFGHVRGAFTGAAMERAGVFEEAHTGTVFLDEVGELSLRAQAKLLRVLQEGEVRRVGENVTRRIDVRVIAATNRTLRDEVAAGRFRLDLLYRLDVIRISIPPLRERRDDIPALIARFWSEATERVGSRAALSASAIGALTQHDWPGNVRELQNVLASLAVRAPRRGAISVEALPPPFRTCRSHQPSWRLADARRVFEEQFVRSALVRTGGHRGRAAQELGISRQGLAKLIGRLNLTMPSTG
jgi:DNA-binding NtrC family response regulator